MIVLGVQVIGRAELERAARKGKRVNRVVIGWAHLNRSVTPELAAAALGRVVTLGGRSGFRRVT